MPLATPPLTLDHEKLLWNSKELDLETSKGLLRAVIFYLIKCFAIWQGKELKHLQTSHISFDENEHGKFVVLDFQSSGSRKKRAIKRYDDPANPRSVYKIMKKYRSRIANEGPFLVRPIISIKDFICFGPLPLGVKVTKSFIQTLMEDAGIGNCFVNYSLNLQSINTLMRFGTGIHCLSSWLMKSNVKSYPSVPECSSVNCEDLNPELIVMVSRLLDAPYPFDAVELIQKMEREEEVLRLHPKFDSWMTNLKKDEEPTELEGIQNQDAKYLDKEALASQSSGCKVSIVPEDDKEKLLADVNKSGGSTNSVNTNLKIMAVSSISEDAFSSQIDEGDHIGRKAQSEKNLESQSSTGIHSKEKTGEKKRKTKLCNGKKRRYSNFGKGVKSDEVISKVAQLGDGENCKNNLLEPVDESNEPPEKKKDDIKKESIDYSELNQAGGKKMTSGHPQEIIICRNKYLDKKNNRRKKQSSVVDDSLICSKKDNFEMPVKLVSEVPSSLGVNSSTSQFNLLKPDTSRDSITILRRLLQQQSGDKIVTYKEREDDNVNKINCHQNCNHRSRVDDTSSSENRKSENSQTQTTYDCGQRIHDGDKTVGEKNNGENPIDLSPPTLSPQPLTGEQTIGEGTTNSNSVVCPVISTLNANNLSTSSGSLLSSDNDIVQFLDKAQQQIKSILNATTTNMNDQSPIKDPKAISVEKPMKDIPVPSKHSRKSRNPMKITTLASSDEESFNMDIVTEEAESSTSCLKSSKSSDQSQFPLLRLFLEKPIEETEVIMASHNSVNIAPKTNHLRNLLSPPKSSTCSKNPNELNDPPVLKYMGNSTNTNSLEVHDCESKNVVKDDHFKMDIKSRKRKHSDCIAVSNDNTVVIPRVSLSSSQSLSSTPSPTKPPVPTVSPPNDRDSQKTNSAIYRVEKDFENNAVYQTLHVKNEKDGAKTFTFADIPNIPDVTTSSKKGQAIKKTSEINLGDYFPSGTLIPAKDIHLITQQGPDGCDIVMKFNFCPKV